ncbi:MAG TPA: AfsR/SARP family transcriptional regulator [Actinocrinis sp.]|uniref:AfsR/SARP family transcriptional regulator n=1 Tax=Actinocrinis sp. TaxID=1920516 RepID=UPI002DDC9263|nr:AfsR/SARP family transcriptional regulator [Actinocrinis sp.]HEV2347879.1 AfsR/SARP family transcriptional regulator [Actinocrinis sp.]
MLSFRILGPLEINTETRVLRPKGSLQSALLTTLLASARQLVPTDALIVELWGEDHPGRVENALQAHISRLRRRLSALEPGAGESRLVTHASGYQLLVRDGELDAASFIIGLEDIRGRAHADATAAVRRLRCLLGLWRGQAFGSLPRGPLRQAAAARYEESRVAALELLYEQELRDGNHARVIPELRELLSRYTFQERFRQLLMVALYRSGRQADALSVYRELWHRLSEELGLEPSPTMRQYERAILDHDPSLNLRQSARPAEPAPAGGGAGRDGGPAPYARRLNHY